MSNETALAYFKLMSQAGINSAVWFELDKMPWAPTYTFDSRREKVVVNTEAHEQWWPRVLAQHPGIRHWKMPFTRRFPLVPHIVNTNATYPFNDFNGSQFHVPVFASVGRVNPVFERYFVLVVRAAVKYNAKMGWTDRGNWVQVSDEPTWTQNETIRNSLALMALFHRASADVRIFQTRFPLFHSPQTAELLDRVDWWCPHVKQYQDDTAKVPEQLANLRAARSPVEKIFT